MLRKQDAHQRDRVVFKKRDKKEHAVSQLNSLNVRRRSEDSTRSIEPNAAAKSGIEISADETEELYSLVGRDSLVTIR